LIVSACQFYSAWPVAGLTKAPLWRKKSGFLRNQSLANVFNPQVQGNYFTMKLLMAVSLWLGVCASSAGAIDLAELAPCKPAAARFCDRHGGMTWNNLVRCGSTLAAHCWRVGSACRAVLHKYGQL
jgi:hypothetical protein